MMPINRKSSDVRYPIHLHGWIATGLFAAIIFGGWGIAPPALFASGNQARAIMEAVNARNDGDSSVAQLEMVLIEPGGQRRERRIKSYSLDRGTDILKIMFFEYPADVQRTGFLTYDYAASGQDDDQWLYLPALRKTNRIASSDQSGSFMGSDFNFSDMTRRDLDSYDYKLIKEEKVKGHMTWRIRSVPKTPDVAKNSGYDKSLLWVRQDNHMVIRSLRWVHNSSRRKYMTINRLDSIDGIWVATEIQMVTKEGRKLIHATVLRQKNTKFNQSLKEQFFTVRSLERGI